MFTDTFGRYIFFVQPGEYMVKAEAFGYQEYLSEPFINEGPVVNFDIPMLLIQSTQLSILKPQINQMPPQRGCQVHDHLVEYVQSELERADARHAAGGDNRQ